MDKIINGLRIRGGAVIIPEETTGKELKRWVRKRKIPLLKRKMRRTAHSDEIRIKASVQVAMMRTKYLNGELTFVRRYLKGNPPMVRTKWPTKYEQS